ncbi:type I-F CRISPR-associated protein Csy2 [Rhodocyclus gracilis]|uniref:Type I-F CRISPR-associated protein Csy2 n=1 Tax=Rhodocyclus tenuis TaxID=1066 RepID=A0A6L5JV73_RHOTE|nr:type I-F CRISPR-associated protein Csy2 [Rhodocyclus gracilis]MQY51287.1 type I-F CRISPR-associated protein Csy2 [Rhodocyclus gracilis]
MSNEANVPQNPAVLVVPHLRVQNANAISSPMTWGFPSITAFTGLMTALERRLGRDAGIAFFGVGVVCHGFEAQVTDSGYTRAFHLTRNPVLRDGSTAGIVEEGRVHLDLTLVFEVNVDDAHRSEAEAQLLAERVAHELAGMRVAGGSVMPPLPGSARQFRRPLLELRYDDSQEEARSKQFRRLARRCLPGFALVSRDDLLLDRLAKLREEQPEASALDAWLELASWTQRAVQRPPKNGETEPTVEWVSDTRIGWTVPIPVGFAALSPVHPAGSVAGARDKETPFRFVETVWSIGQWISPHRLHRLDDLFWYPTTQPDIAADAEGEIDLYCCRNDYTPPTPARLAEASV